MILIILYIWTRSYTVTKDLRKMRKWRVKKTTRAGKLAAAFIRPLTLYLRRRQRPFDFQMYIYMPPRPRAHNKIFVSVVVYGVITALTDLGSPSPSTQPPPVLYPSPHRGHDVHYCSIAPYFDECVYVHTIQGGLLRIVLPFFSRILYSIIIYCIQA